MERSVSLMVLGPALYRSAVEQRLAASGQVVKTEQPEVVLLLGGRWMVELGQLRGGARDRDSFTPVLVTHPHADLLLAVQLGIEVFLDEDGGEAELFQAIRAAATGSGYCSPSLMPGLFRGLRPLRSESQIRPPTADRLAVLSEREREVALSVGRGWKSAQVAKELHLSVATVKFHLSNIYAKLGIECRAELIAYLSHAHGEAGAAPH